MKNYFFLATLFIAIFIYSCDCNTNADSCGHDKDTEQIVETSDFLINATLWVQHSGEFRSLCYQAFNIAKTSLNNNIKIVSKDKPAAVVFDIDETLLDNSYFETYLIQNNTTYSKENWKEWSDMECATAIPGAIDFLNYVVNSGAEIVYVSNRRDNELEATKNNMMALGFPEAKDENFFFRTDESSKINRRAMVEERYNIVLLVGDNLSDFDGDFDDRSVNNGWDAVDSSKEMFGTYYIVLPNPMYGNWEQALKKDENKTGRQNKIDALLGYETCK